MRKIIVAEMHDDWIQPYARQGEKVPVVVLSTHPRHEEGDRLDWGFVKAAMEDGYDIFLCQP